MLVYEYISFPLAWKIVNALVLSVSFARLTSSLSHISWHRLFVYGLSIFLITNIVLEYLNCPIPLFRIFIVSAGLIGSICSWLWSRENIRLQGPAYMTGLLRLISTFYMIMVIAEI